MSEMHAHFALEGPYFTRRQLEELRRHDEISDRQLYHHDKDDNRLYRNREDDDYDSLYRYDIRTTELIPSDVHVPDYRRVNETETSSCLPVAETRPQPKAGRAGEIAPQAMWESTAEQIVFICAILSGTNLIPRNTRAKYSCAARMPVGQNLLAKLTLRRFGQKVIKCPLSQTFV